MTVDNRNQKGCVLFDASCVTEVDNTQSYNITEYVLYFEWIEFVLHVTNKMTEEIIKEIELFAKTVTKKEKLYIKITATEQFNSRIPIVGPFF